MLTIKVSHEVLSNLKVLSFNIYKMSYLLTFLYALRNIFTHFNSYRDKDKSFKVT